MSNVVCSEYCSESVVTCFVCKEWTLKEFECIVGDSEGYINSSAESVVTCSVCKELTLKEFEGKNCQIYQTVKTVNKSYPDFLNSESGQSSQIPTILCRMLSVLNTVQNL